MEGPVLPLESEHAATGSDLSAHPGTAGLAGTAAETGGGMSTGEEPAAPSVRAVDFSAALGKGEDGSYSSSD